MDFKFDQLNIQELLSKKQAATFEKLKNKLGELAIEQEKYEVS